MQSEGSTSYERCWQKILKPDTMEKIAKKMSDATFLKSRFLVIRTSETNTTMPLVT